MNEQATLEQARAVLHQHRSELMERFGATGIGIGKDEGSGGHVISVYLETVDQFPSEQAVVGEVPLRFGLPVQSNRSRRGERWRETTRLMSDINALGP